jgi:phospholipase C
MAMAKIDHVFVLIMENRSFDHMFAFSGLPGIQPPLNPNFKPGDYLAAYPA